MWCARFHECAILYDKLLTNTKCIKEGFFLYVNVISIHIYAKQKKGNGLRVYVLRKTHALLSSMTNDFGLRCHRWYLGHDYFGYRTEAATEVRKTLITANGASNLYPNRHLALEFVPEPIRLPILHLYERTGGVGYNEF